MEKNLNIIAEEYMQSYRLLKKKIRKEYRKLKTLHGNDIYVQQKKIKTLKDMKNQVFDVYLQIKKYLD